MKRSELPLIVPHSPITEGASVTGRELASISLGRCKVLTLPLGKLQPVLRIAHRNIRQELRERIIRDYELVHIISGGGKLVYKNQTIHFDEGGILCIPPFVRHQFVLQGLAEHIALHFDLAPNFPAFAANLHRRQPYEVRLTHGLVLPRYYTPVPEDSIVPLIPEIVANFIQRTPLGRVRADALLATVLTSLLVSPKRSASSASFSPEEVASKTLQTRLSRSLLYLEKHFAEAITPPQLARAAGLSVRHFSRIFHVWAGISPGESVLRRRVDEARKLLAHTDLPIKEIASRCGFEDPYYFSRVFRRIDGVPPTEFREARSGVPE